MAVAVRITAVGTLVSALEELSRPDDMHDRSLFSWPIRRSGLRVLSNRRLGAALSVFKHPRYSYVIQETDTRRAAAWVSQ